MNSEEIEELYSQLEKLKNGNENDKELAIDCYSLLSDELIELSYEEKLNIIKRKLNKYKEESTI